MRITKDGRRNGRTREEWTVLANAFIDYFADEARRYVEKHHERLEAEAADDEATRRLLDAYREANGLVELASGTEPVDTVTTAQLDVAFDALSMQLRATKTRDVWWDPDGTMYERPCTEQHPGHDGRSDPHAHEFDNA